MKKVALFGGGFDPIHEGHIHIARLAQMELQLDEVIFIPLKEAVHKKSPYLDQKQRVLLIMDAIKPYAYMSLSDIELKRQGPSYTIDTVNDFLQHDQCTDLDLYYIIGADAFEKFFTWKEPERLLQLLKFIVVSRPGYDFRAIERQFAQEQHEQYLDNLFFIEDPGIDLSSTQIRGRMQ